jgi:uncharacterized protein
VARHPKRQSHASPLFVDSWGWLVLAETCDPLHQAVLEIRRIDAANGLPWITTDYVLDETITRLFSKFPFHEADFFCQGIFDAAETGFLRIETVTADRFQRAFALRRRYHDKPRISFTDFTSFAVMEELRIRRVLTADAHFVQVGMGFERVP